MIQFVFRLITLMEESSNPDLLKVRTTIKARLGEILDDTLGPFHVVTGEDADPSGSLASSSHLEIRQTPERGWAIYASPWSAYRLPPGLASL